MTYTRGTDLANCPEYCKHLGSRYEMRQTGPKVGFMSCPVKLTRYCLAGNRTCPRELHDDQRLRLMDDVCHEASEWNKWAADFPELCDAVEALAAYDKEHGNA